MREVDHAANFWRHVVRSATCWLWSSTLDKDGYGQVTRRFDGKIRMLKAHRIAWELAYGAIPPGLAVCHSCDVRNCVNPSHLWLGTLADNARDMFAKGRGRHGLEPRRSHCKRGHPFDERNTHINPKTGARTCRACLAAHARRYRRTRATF